MAVSLDIEEYFNTNLLTFTGNVLYYSQNIEN